MGDCAPVYRGGAVALGVDGVGGGRPTVGENWKYS